MFCEKCGTDMKDNKVCPNCGFGTEKPIAEPSIAQNNGLTENVAGLLCYVLGWISGIFFIFIDKRPFVRFHAIQSTIIFGGISVFTFIFNWIISLFPYALWRLFSSIDTLISLGSLALGIFLIYQAYHGKWYKLPVIGDTADKLKG